MMKRTAPVVFFALISASLCSQSRVSAQAPDSSDAKTLQNVVIKAYDQNRKLIDIPAPVGFTGQTQLDRDGNTGILNALNLTPGVSMEERSPASYRLNIRGSSLRSPFGVRDVKIYLDEIPLTDPSGNTYLNQLSFYNFQSAEIIKGPAGSLYGASIGGAMLIHTQPVQWERGEKLDYTWGSYDAANLNIRVRLGDADHQQDLNYSHLSGSGYRQETAMRRDIVSWQNQLRATGKQTLKTFIYYSDLYYQTPGGLTKAEYDSNGRQARPGAVAAKAAVDQKTFIAGFTDEYVLSKDWQNITALYGAYTDFLNPGLRVYELRKEPHVGGRTVFQFKKGFGESVLRLNFGSEAQKGFFNTRDYGNNQGNPDSLETDDNINLWQYMVFAQADLTLPGGWIVTAGASLNRSALQFVNLTARPATYQTRTFNNKLPPHLGLLRKITGTISVYTNIARGFSTPTSAELLSSDGLLGTNLQPEDGMDYELGARGSFLHDRFYFDISGFLFHLHNTIVERIDTNGVYYYVNAGSTKQNGVESYLSYQLIDNKYAWVCGAKLFVSYAWHDFHYGDFKQLTADYSGNQMPGVAPQSLTAGLDLVSRNGFFFHFTYRYSDAIRLNDANTDIASPYHLLSVKLGYRALFNKKLRGAFFAGVDNLLNTKYSLGDDFNAAAGRYYNTAPGINFYAGVTLSNLLPL